MAIEFLLLAFLDGQEPVNVKRYETLSSCQDDASQVTEYVQNNYTELRNADDLQKIIILGLLAEFNEKWEMVKIPVPSAEETETASNLWAIKLIIDADEVAMRANEYNAPALQMDAINLKEKAQRYIDNSERPTRAPSKQPNFTVSPYGVYYSCLAVPD